jgi:glycogen debranching enzyme
MDTIDRTAKPIEIESFWALTLDAIMKVGESLGEKKDFTTKYRDIIHFLNEDYWSENTGYFVDTIKKNGSKDYRVRPNAILPVVFGLIEDNKALKAAKRMLQEDMFTDWGVRTLSAQDDTYDPRSYHDGSVWPLDTGWVAAACFKTGLIEDAYNTLRKMSRNIVEWKGMYAELYRGDLNEPYTSCINQAWSHAMFLWPVLDFMLGISPLHKENKLRIEPKIPSSLHLKVEGLSYGDNRYSIEVNKDKIRIASQKEISVDVAGRIKKGDVLEF